MRIFKFFVFLTSLFLISCSSKPPTAGNFVLDSGSKSGDIAQHIITRDNSMMYLLGKAVIQINGLEVGTLKRGQTLSFDIPAGLTSIKVYDQLGPGSFSLTRQSKKGEVYKYIVSPNSSAAWKASLCGMLCEDKNGYWKILPAS